MTVASYKPAWVLRPKMFETDVSTLFVVPDGVYALAVIMVAPGGKGMNIRHTTGSIYRTGGGSGGWWEGTIAVTPGETLELTIGQRTSIARAGTVLHFVCKGSDAETTIPNYTYRGGGDGGFPNGSGGGRNRLGVGAGGCGTTSSYTATLANRPIFDPSCGSGINHGNAMYGTGKFPGGGKGSGGRTPYPWGAAGEAYLSTVNSVHAPGPGRFVLTWMQPSSRS